MLYGPSTFYHNFSLSELLKRYGSFSETDVSGSGDSFSVSELSGGGGISAEGGSIFPGTARESQHHKSETSSFPIRTQLFVESEFMSLLKTEVKDEIIKAGAHPARDTDVRESEFYIEYEEPGIKGRIGITGERTPEGYYSLNATLEESSKSDAHPPFNFRELFRSPVGTFHVVTFGKGEDAAAQEFFEVGRKALEDAVGSVSQELQSSYQGGVITTPNFDNVEVYVWQPLPFEISKKWEELMREDIQVPEEYESFETVYFLNEVALTMYEATGHVFKIVKSIPASEVPKTFGPSLRGPFQISKP